MRIYWILLFCWFNLLTYGQQGAVKYEKETRIQLREVPEQARQFVEALKFDSKVKWYREQSLEQVSFEAKTKSNGKKYSIEFSAQGQIQDIEIIISKQEIPKASLDQITAYFKQNYDRFKFCKVQIQYTGSEQELQNLILENTSHSPTQIHYELVVQTKKAKDKTLQEYLFDSKGKYLRNSEIIFRNTDNLNF